MPELYELKGLTSMNTGFYGGTNPPQKTFKQKLGKSICDELEAIRHPHKFEGEYMLTLDKIKEILPEKDKY